MASAKTAELTILNGATESGHMNPGPLTEALSIMAPPTLPETVTVQVADTFSPVAADWRDLQSGGADVTLTADKATVIEAVPFKSMRLSAGAAVAADRTFDVVEQEGIR